MNICNLLGVNNSNIPFSELNSGELSTSSFQNISLDDVELITSGSPCQDFAIRDSKETSTSLQDSKYLTKDV